MTIFQAFILGLVQGLGEFLPISSSGHIALLEVVMGVETPGITMTVLLHLGTLAAVVAIYWKQLLDMVLHPLKSDLWKLIVATLPAVAAALLLGKHVNALFTPRTLGLCFLLTGVLLGVSECVAVSMGQSRRPEGRISPRTALIMGCMQALAIPPGISRSGATIVGGLIGGAQRSRAADFAFMMSVPAILGSTVLEARHIMDPGVIAASGGVLALIVATLTAAVSGYLAIRAMLYVVRRLSLHIFAVYTGALGVMILLDQFVFHIFF